MEIASVMNSYATGRAAAANTAGAGSLDGFGSGNFMMMLMAQLRNQNPLEPMQDTEMISQVTLLNSLQELQKMQSQIEQLAISSQASYASSLIGKQVRALLPDGTTVEGTVKAATWSSGSYTLTVGDKEVPMDTVNTILQGEAA